MRRPRPRSMADLSPLINGPVRVTVAGAVLVVPYAPARAWLRALDRHPASAVLDLSEGSRSVVVGLATGAVTAKAVQDATNTAVATLTGQKWWIALRLVYTSSSPDFLGELTLAGVDPDRVSLGQWTAAVYRILTRNADAKERVRIDFELDIPPSGYEDSWDDDADYYARMVAEARKFHTGD